MKNLLFGPILIGVLIAACAHKPMNMESSTRIPAAIGSVSVTKEPNDNTGIDLFVQHMAPPDKLDANARTYMVWEKAPDPGAAPQPLGALLVDKNLNGRLRTITPLKSLDLFITAENSSDVKAPTGERLLWTSISR